MSVTVFNTKMGQAILASDLFATCNTPTFLRWNVDTLNTPYKAGLTSSPNGFAFVFGNSGTAQTILAFASGTADPFYHSCSQDTPTGWLRSSAYLHLEFNEANGNIVIGSRKGNGTAIQLATTVDGIQLQRKTTPDGEWEVLWNLTKQTI